MSRRIAGALAGIVLLSGCSSQTQWLRSPGATTRSIHRVVVLPFVDDPLVPGSGVRAAAFFQRQARLRIKNVDWIGPLELLKDQGISTDAISLEDNVGDTPQALEPLLGKVLSNGALEPFLGKALSPTDKSVELAQTGEQALAAQYQADAVLRGSVLLDPGTGMIESMVTQSRSARVALSLQLLDPKSGKVLVAFRQRPHEDRTHPTENQFIREAVDEAVERWAKL